MKKIKKQTWRRHSCLFLCFLVIINKNKLKKLGVIVDCIVAQYVIVYKYKEHSSII